MKISKTVLFVSFLTAAGLVHAQTWKSGLKVIRRSGTEAAYKATEISRQITERVRLSHSFLRKPVLTSLEPNIHRFIFTVSPRGHENGFKGSGFVFAEKHLGKTILWGTSAAHTVRNMGSDVTVTFHLDGKDISFPATVELTGRKFGINAALIKLPEEAAEVALPIELAPEALSPQTTVFTYGFSNGSFKKTVRSVLVPGTERLLADFPSFNAPKPGFCGSVVLNEQGRAVGIETGGYELKHVPWLAHTERFSPLHRTSRISEIVPINQLHVLLREYHTPQAGARAILLQGINVGQVGVSEFIDRIFVEYNDGTLKILEHSPLWELLYLDQAIPNINQAKTVQIVINKNRTEEYAYRVDLNTRKVTREEF